ncbi:MAG: response regulator transcription factor [Burkholderiales bacterium]
MRILLAENDPLHRAFLRSAVEGLVAGAPEIVEAEDGRAAIEAACAAPPDLAVLDVEMPEASGVDAARAIWRANAGARILFWSNYADEAYLRALSKIVPADAAYGYVLKSASATRLRVALRGVFLEDRCIIDREVRGVQQRAEDRLEGLTDSEYEILVDLALGLTDKAIAARLGISVRGAQIHLQHLYEKLRVVADGEGGGEWGPTYNSRTRAVYLALSRGLLNPGNLGREDRRLAAWLAAHRGAT